MTALEINTRSGISRKGNRPLNNPIDKEVQKIFKPLNIMQNITLNPNCHIKNDIINPNNNFNKFIVIGGAVLIIALYIHRMWEIVFDDNIRRYNKVNVLLFASYVDFMVKLSGVLINFYINIFKTSDTVLFILYFQKVHRFLNNGSNIKKFIVGSWLGVILIFAFYTFVTLYVYFSFLRPPFNVLCFIFISVSHDANIIYLLRVMKLLTDKMLLWNVKLSLIDENYCNRVHSIKMLLAYDNILKCYKITTDIFQLPMLFKTTEMFIACMINVEIFIQYVLYGKSGNPLASTYLYFWIARNLVMQISISKQIDDFYQAVSLSQNSCLFILASNSSGNLKTLCKNILRVHRTSFSKMSVCGLFYMDICHPLSFVVLILNYIFVLLQFAFLDT